MDELSKIKDRYEARKASKTVEKHFESIGYYQYLIQERGRKLEQILKTAYSDLSKITLIEIGAGGGESLAFFNELGIPWGNIWANELLEDRGEALKQKVPETTIEICDALDLDHIEKFDVVYISTVFTSILDRGLKERLAAKVFSMLKPGGMVLWYDFKYDNPYNKDVQGVSKKEVRHLFSNARGIQFFNVTLAPPIGRRIGRLYPLVNTLFPFLRTHLIAIVKK